ncbi:hypothetical protein ABK040_006113 [Willaertia magna]
MLHNHTNSIAPTIGNENPQNTKAKNNIDSNNILKRKALGDITNQNPQQRNNNNNNKQPTKKVKVIGSNSNNNNTKQKTPISIFSDESNTQVKETKKLIHKKPTLMNTTSHNKIQLWEDDLADDIEICPNQGETPEYEIPDFSEFNPITGEVEDFFVTLSKEKMEELTTIPKSDFLLTKLMDKNEIKEQEVSSPKSPPMSPITLDILF